MNVLFEILFPVGTKISVEVISLNNKTLAIKIYLSTI